jgi:hypothetical protein
MRMASLELAGNGMRNGIEIVLPALTGQLGMEHHLEQQVTEFIAQGCIVAGLDGGDHLAGFLQRVACQ